MERLLASLFLSGPTAPATWRRKLALLAYYLADGSFLPASEVADGFKRAFDVPAPEAVAWLLQLFLDDAQLVPPGGAPNSSLAQAANFLPGVDGGAVPFKMVAVFLARGRADVALGLLRQRADASGLGLGEALVALRVRLANGLLAEGFLEMRRHLEAAPAAQRAQHADRLVSELMAWGAKAGGLHGIVRLPFGGGEEEGAAVAWLQRSAARNGVPQAGLMLSLFYLMRGRTPEALHAFATHCPPPAAAGEDAPAADGRAARLAELRAQLEALLHAAARMLPAPQRALVVAHGACPALRVSQGGDDADDDNEGLAGSVALAAAVLGLDAGGMPAVVSTGPSPATAPLVGSIPDLASGARRSGAADAAGAAEEGGAAPGGPAAVAPLLFGQQQPSGGGGAAAGAGAVQAFGAAAVAAPLPSGPQHELDRLLGLAAPSATRGARGVRRASVASTTPR
jgi:hypothetical protein